MKKRHIPYTLLILLLCIPFVIEDCKKREIQNELDDVELATKSAENWNSGIGIYEQFYYETDKSFGYASLKENSLATEEVLQIKDEGTGHALRTTTELKLKKVLVNGIALKENNTSLTKGASSSPNLLDSWYGQDVDFVFEREGLLKSGESKSDTISMYVPELIKITAPKIQTEKELYPYLKVSGSSLSVHKSVYGCKMPGDYCKLGHFLLKPLRKSAHYDDDYNWSGGGGDPILKWNSDGKNKNGVIIMVEWLGFVDEGKQPEDVYVVRSRFIANDNGSATLYRKMFDDIPDGALIYITVLRGNVRIKDIGGYSVKTYGASEAVLPAFLVRDLAPYIRGCIIKK